MDLQLGYHCNNDCISCITPQSVEGRTNDYPLVIKKAEEADVVTLGGGEPTVNPNFSRFLSEFRDKCPETPLHVLTNARKFSDPDFGESIDSSLEPIKFSVSLYSHREKIHDRVTQVEGSLSQTLEGLENLLEKGLEMDIKLILNSLNYKHVPETVEFLNERFEELNKIIIVFPRFTGSAWENREEVFIPLERAAPYVEMAAERFENVELYHFPLCKLHGEAVERAATGVTKHESDGVVFQSCCNGCRMRDSCPGIWETYLQIDENFHAEPYE